MVEVYVEGCRAASRRNEAQGRSRAVQKWARPDGETGRGIKAEEEVPSVPVLDAHAREEVARNGRLKGVIGG
jgi:hypothetical protein